MLNFASSCFDQARCVLPCGFLSLSYLSGCWAEVRKSRVRCTCSLQVRMRRSQDGSTSSSATPWRASPEMGFLLSPCQAQQSQRATKVPACQLGANSNTIHCSVSPRFMLLGTYSSPRQKHYVSSSLAALGAPAYCSVWQSALLGRPIERKWRLFLTWIS